MSTPIETGNPGPLVAAGRTAGAIARTGPTSKTRSPLRRGEAKAGWLFVAPAVLIILIFMLIPVAAALWVSVSNWTGRGSPLAASYIGLDNYQALLGKPNLQQRDLATALRNNLYYVILVVPLQTILALTLALVLNRRRLAGRGFFRTAFYFPSVTSSVAISIVFLFIFNASGVTNAVLAWFGVHGPNWFADPRGVLQLLLGALGVDSAHPPGWLMSHSFLGLNWWQWLSGPSIAMCAIMFLAIWTTGGTFMLIFLAALQDIPEDIEEAAAVDGASSWQIFRKVLIPQLKPTLFLVITLGLIGTWQVFDQVYIMTQGGPSKTTLTPAYLSYQTSFKNGKWGQGAAIAFILFFIIVIFSLLQRFVMRDRKTLPRRHRFASWADGMPTKGGS